MDHKLVKNTPNVARVGHKLKEICDNSPQFARFSLKMVIKKAHPYFGGISFKEFLYRRYEVYRGYIVFAFSVIMFVCLSVVCKLFFRQRFLSNYVG